MTTFRTSTRIALAAMTTSVALIAAAPAVAQESGAAVHHVKNPARSLALVTAEQMRKAKPAQMPHATKAAAPGTRAAPEGAPITVEGTRTTLSIRRNGKTKRPGSKKAMSSYFGLELPWRSSGYGTSAPNAAVGRIFFRTPTGGSSFCTGTVVSANIVLTAAHCVRNGRTGAWNKSWVFVPGVNGASRPHGSFSARTATAPALWSQAPYNGVAGTNREGYFPADYAFLVLNRNAAGRHVSSYTGAYGILANGPTGNVSHLGYPGEGPWAAGCTTASCRPWVCNAPIQRFTQYVGGRYDVGFSCYTSGGASGGPVFQTYNGRWYVSSNLSHMGVPRSASGGRYGLSFFGPRFDNSTITLFNYARTL